MKQQVRSSRTAKSQVFEKIAAYSASAATFLLISQKAEGEIVYYDIDPDFVMELGDVVTVDIDGDGALDMIFQLYMTSGSNWSFARVFGSVTSFTVGGPSNAFIGYSGAFLPYASALSSGDAIGAAADFMYNSGNQVFIASIYYGVTYGAFAGATDKYLGFQFVISGAIHYGWMRLDATVDPVSLTIKDWAYEDVADTPIAAGEMAPPPAEVTFSTDLINVDEAAGTATVSVTLSETADFTVDVDLNAGLTTATAGSDFDFTDPSPITFTAGGPTTQSFTVDILEDLFDEPDETIVLDLSGAVGGIIAEPSEITININDNDGPPGIEFTAATASLNEDPTTYTGSVSIDVAIDCSVDLTLNAGLSTATEGSDFDFSSPMTLNFTAGGATSLDFDIDVLEDAAAEPDETVVIELGGVTGACILDGDDTFTLSITNDDMLPTPSVVSITEQHVTYDESDGTITGTVALDVTNDCNVDVVLEGTGTASEGVDFTFTDPTAIEFTDGGSLTQTYDVNIIDDAESESVEIINFSLQNATGNCTIDAIAGTMMLHIIDNDDIGIDGVDGAAALLYGFENTLTVQILNAGWEKASVQVFDNSGKLIFTSAVNQGSNQFDLGEMPYGVYVVQLTIDDTSVQKQVFLGKN